MPAAREHRTSSGVRAKTTMPVVLVVDDTDDNVELFSTVLREAGFVVVTARDGAEAVETAALERPDVVLLDLSMPGMDGFEAAVRLRALENGSRMSIIAVTALTDAGSRARAHAAGCDAFLTKPCVPSSLVRHVREACAALDGDDVNVSRPA